MKGRGCLGLQWKQSGFPEQTLPNAFGPRSLRRSAANTLREVESPAVLGQLDRLTDSVNATYSKTLVVFHNPSLTNLDETGAPWICPLGWWGGLEDLVDRVHEDASHWL
jgi:hypothetical protein